MLMCVDGFKQKTSYEMRISDWSSDVCSSDLLWATEDISGVRVKVSDLTSEEGSVIASTAVEPSFVRYVMTDEFAGGCGKRKPADFDSSLVADVLDVIPVMDISAKPVPPICIQIQLPRNAAPAQQQGKINFYTKKP